ncbi:MAG TPA: 3TM-type holin [Burkholderiales bacterium]|nr:3TM-type holin [Burkholderiales bacterium]
MNELVQLAPAILGFLGGPAGGLAGAALQWLAGKTGAKDSTVTSIKDALGGMSADKVIELRKLDIEFQEFCMTNNIQINLAQIEVNKVEAASSNWWTSGWRPGVGWAGVGALVLVYWPKAIVLTLLWTYQTFSLVHGAPDVAKVVLPAFPDLGVTDLLGLLGSILGIGGMRTVEKVTGTEGNR